MRATIGPYRVIDVVGAGGMGTVYRVMHERTGRVAAAKVLNAEGIAPTALERFRNEARIHQTLAHPAIAAMYEFLEGEGAPCLVMEYVDGETIDDRIRRRGPIPFAESVRIFATLADAVGYLHQRGIVHRDLKTSNVKLDAAGRVKLLDFGIATAEGSPRLTRTGNVVGTLMALAPEQLRTGRAEPRSDLWALGVLFYEMLTGRAPFEGGGPAALTEKILKGTYVAPSSVDGAIPREADRIVARCLRVRVEERYASAEALVTDLRALESADREAAPFHARAPRVLVRASGEMALALAREWRLGAAVGAAALALAFLAWSVWPSPAPAPPPAPPVAGASLGTPPAASKGASPIRPSVPTPATTLGPADGARDRAGDVSLRRVIIRVWEGTADVYRAGVRVGSTPYPLEAPIGAEVSLVLRRAGCDDLSVTLRVAEGMDEFVESLRHCRAP